MRILDDDASLSLVLGGKPDPAAELLAIGTNALVCQAILTEMENSLKEGQVVVFRSLCRYIAVQGIQPVPPVQSELVRYCCTL